MKYCDMCKTAQACHAAGRCLVAPFNDTLETDKFRAGLDGMREINQRDQLLRHARKLERQRNVAVAALKSLASQSGHKSAPGCNCMDCQYIRPLEEAIRYASSENTSLPHP